jgi:bacterioferritin-associated ferredoxin
MIVCSCNVFSDRDVRSAIDSAASRPATANQVYGCLGCSPQCGRCARTIRRIMDEALISASCAQGCPVACAHVEVIEERVDVVERHLARVER